MKLISRQSMSVTQDSSPADVSNVLEEELAGVPREELAAGLWHDLMSYNGPSICFGIMLAGAVYPMVVAVCLLAGLVIHIVTNLAQFSSVDQVGALLTFWLVILVYATGGALLSLMWVGAVAMITLPITYLFVRSLKLHGSLVSLGAASGGVVGFIAVMPWTVSLPWIGGAGEFWLYVVGILLGPCLATVLGQLGGAWGGRRAALHLANYYGIVATSNSDRAARIATELRAETSESVERRGGNSWQFGIRHMMWLIVWFSLLLSVIRLSGVPFGFAIPLLAGWIVYQWFTLRVGARLWHWIGPKWAAKRALRST
jgi:hypothetical protein